MLKEHLQELVDLVGHALKAEDEFIRTCCLRKSISSMYGHSPSIVSVFRESFFQYVILRKLLSDFRFFPAVEKDRFDLVLYRDPMDDDYIAVGEIKLLTSKDGEKEIPSLHYDRLKMQQSGKPGFGLYITHHPKGQLKENLEFFAERLQVQPNDFVVSVFETIGNPPNEDGWAECEIAVIGLLCSR